MTESADHYAVMKLRHDATPAQIRSAYKNLSRLHHPDMNPGNPKATDAMAKINVSYDVLSNPDTRKEYDSQLARQRAAAQKPARETAPPTSSPPGGAYQAEVFTQHFPDPAPEPKEAPRKKKRRTVDLEAEQREENRAFLALLARRALVAAVLIIGLIYIWRQEYGGDSRVARDQERIRAALHRGR